MLFCGAQTLVADVAGKVIAIGGTNMVQWQAGLTRGSVGAFEFDNVSVSDPTGPQWDPLTDLPHRRYYPGCLRQADGTVVTYGGVAGTAAAEAVEHHDEYNGTTWDAKLNIDLAEFGCAEIPQVTYSMVSGNYADVHLLATGNWLRCDDGGSDMFDKTICSVQNPPSERFETWVNTSIPGGKTPRNFGNSVHYFYLDANDGRHEVIYSLAGNDMQGCVGTFYPTVLKMVDPKIDPNTRWIEMPDLNEERHTGNTIILLDGSMIMIGGAKLITSAPCTPVHEVERFRPPEIFENPSGAWQLMAPLWEPRTYHSVAALLADGSVVCGGGVGTHDPIGQWQPSWHSFERYRPPYFYSTVRRPVIDSVSSESWAYGDTVTVNVSLMNQDAGEFRVALLSPCSGTHGVDFNQRYIELVSSEDR
jgi:hypothetical protein